MFHKNEIQIIEPSANLKCENVTGKLPLLMWNDKFGTSYISGKWFISLCNFELVCDESSKKEVLKKHATICVFPTILMILYSFLWWPLDIVTNLIRDHLCFWNFIRCHHHVYIEQFDFINLSFFRFVVQLLNISDAYYLLCKS